MAALFNMKKGLLEYLIMLRSLIFISVTGIGLWGMLSPVPCAAVQNPSPSAALKEEETFKTRDALIDQLIRMHELKQSLSEASSQVKFFASDLRELGLPPESAWITKHVLVSAYDAPAYLRVFKDHLKEHFNEEHAREVIKWLRSPLTKKTDELEDRSYTDDATAERIIYVEMLDSFPPPEKRLDLSERLEAAWNVTDHFLDILAPIIRLWFPHREKFYQDSPRSLIKKWKDDMRKSVREATVKGLLHTYLDLTDEEFASFVKFAESDAGKWYDEAFRAGMVLAFDKQVERARIHLEEFLEKIESEKEGLTTLKETFPPGERYIALRTRDPFMPLVDEKEGLIGALDVEPKKDFSKFRDQVELPLIPVEILKRVEKEDPELLADLNYYEELFNNKEELDSMQEGEYLETLEIYKELIIRANDLRADFIKTDLQKEIGSLKLVGVIQAGGQPLALVETKQGKGFSVRKGTMVGPDFGVVDSIEEEKIVILERYRDYLGEILAKKHTLEFKSAGQEPDKETL